jgi:hypothetical protein
MWRGGDGWGCMTAQQHDAGSEKSPPGHAMLTGRVPVNSTHAD